jgi:PKD repeat protein
MKLDFQMLKDRPLCQLVAAFLALLSYSPTLKAEINGVAPAPSLCIVVPFSPSLQKDAAPKREATVWSERESGGSQGRSPSTAALPIPRVSLSITPTPAVAGTPVTFSAQIAYAYPDLKYRFAFGDKSQTDWQDKPEATHAYPATGSYLAYVDIGVTSNGVVRQMGGSVRQQIQVTLPPLGAVDLSANPTAVEVGKPVTFEAKVGSKDPNMKYRFIFGDNSPSSGWQDSPQATHAYASANTYQAYVDVGIINNGFVKRAGGSAGQSIRVMRPLPVTVNLTANPSTIEMGQSVLFNAHVERPTGAAASAAAPVFRDADIKYRFVFGDGSPASVWQDSPQATHRYSNAGNYQAYVEVALGNASGAVVRSTKQVSVAPLSGTNGASVSQSPGGPTLRGSGITSSTDLNRNLSSPLEWWRLLILALLALLIGYQAYRLLLRPRPTFRSYPDAGVSEVNTGTQELQIDSQVVLRPDLSEARYLVYTDELNIVRSLRRKNV